MQDKGVKKFIPLVLLVVGLLVVGGVYFFVIRDKKTEEVVFEEEETIAEIPLDMRPLTSLTPIKEGHWLKMTIQNIKVAAATMDYELLYKGEDGQTQGVPGTVKLTGESKIERELLLGSESSGKFRYDQGVEEGTLTLRFRNDKGKVVGKLSTSFHLQNAVQELTSLDGKFAYTLDRVPKGTFFVTMETFGVPSSLEGTVSTGPYGVFSSGNGPYAGKVKMDGNVNYWDGSKWNILDDKASKDLGIFASTSQ